MASPLDCGTTCCPQTISTEIPGVQGQNAYTFVSASFVVPPLGNQVTVSVINTDWISVGQTLFIEGAGLFTVSNINSSTSLLLTYDNITTNTSAGATIAIGAEVSAAGLPGADGVGQNAYTVTTGGFTTPAIGSNTASVAVGSSAWMTIGQDVFVQTSGYYKVISKADSAHFVGQYLNVAANINAGNVIAAGAEVSPAGTKSNLSAALPTAFTDNTGGAATNTLAAGVGISTLTFYTNLIDITAADLIGAFTPGYKFKILAVNFAVEKPATTAAKAATLTPKITGVAVTGGVLSLTSANCTPAGTVVAGSAVTAANTGSSSDTITITGSGITAFVEGNGIILMRIQNMDVADALASISSHINSLITALT